MAFSDRIKKRVVGWSQKGMERLFSDEKRAMRIANALGAVQRGKQSVDKAQTTVMRQLNFATRSDFKDIGRQLSGLKKRVRSLEEKLSQL